MGLEAGVAPFPAIQPTIGVWGALYILLSSEIERFLFFPKLYTTSFLSFIGVLHANLGSWLMSPRAKILGDRELEPYKVGAYAFESTVVVAVSYRPSVLPVGGADDNFPLLLGKLANSREFRNDGNDN